MPSIDRSTEVLSEWRKTLKNLDKKQLVSIAKEKRLKGYSKLNKKDLIELIMVYIINSTYILLR